MAVTKIDYVQYDKGKVFSKKTFIALQKGDRYKDDNLVSNGAGCIVIQYYLKSDHVEWVEYEANDPRWLNDLLYTQQSPGWERD